MSHKVVIDHIEKMAKKKMRSQKKSTTILYGERRAICAICTGNKAHGLTCTLLSTISVNVSSQCHPNVEIQCRFFPLANTEYNSNNSTTSTVEIYLELDRK